MIINITSDNKVKKTSSDHMHLVAVTYVQRAEQTCFYTRCCMSALRGWGKCRKGAVLQLPRFFNVVALCTIKTKLLDNMLLFLAFNAFGEYFNANTVR